MGSIITPYQKVQCGYSSLKSYVHILLKFLSFLSLCICYVQSSIMMGHGSWGWLGHFGLVLNWSELVRAHVSSKCRTPTHNSTRTYRVSLCYYSNSCVSNTDIIQWLMNLPIHYLVQQNGRNHHGSLKLLLLVMVSSITSFLLVSSHHCILNS